MSEIVKPVGYMLRASFYVLVVVVPQALCHADVTKLSQEHRLALQDTHRFRQVRAVANLPPAIVTLCADDRGRFAEPGQKWEATDFITDDTLPRKRLIWAVTGGDYYVVHYERGGYAHSFHVLVATFKQGKPKATVVWRGAGERLKNFKAFLAALENGGLDDRLDYTH